MAPKKNRSKGASGAAAAQHWRIGDLILAKVKGFPAWPAQVSRPEEFGRQRNPARVFVVFFGTQQIRFCHTSEISAFTPEARAALHSRILSKCVPSDLRRAVREICKAADDSQLNDAEAERKDGDVAQGTDAKYSGKERHEAANEATTQSLESRRSNGLQRLSRRCRIEDSDDCSMHSNVPSNVHREWESSCTNSCNSLLEEVVPPSDRVVTNCAPHEDLDSPVQQVEDTEPRQLEKFTWSKQSSRTGYRFRRFLRKADADTVDCKSSKFACQEISEQASHAEGFGESLNSKNITKRQRTACVKRRLESFSAQTKTKGLEDDPDRHLPLLKRARARVMHEGPSGESRHPRDEFVEITRRETIKCETVIPVSKRRYANAQEDTAPETSSQGQNGKLRATKCKGRAAKSSTQSTGYLRNGKAFVDREVPLCGNEKRGCEKLRLASSSKEQRSNETTHRQPRRDRDEPCSMTTNQNQKAGEEEDSDIDEGTVLKRKLAEYYGSSKTVDNLDDLPFISTTSRFHCEGVNKVRQAYEAAKEKKQKLASKNASGPSTSMKFLLAAAQNKQLHPALVHRSSDSQREALISAEALAAQYALERMLSDLSRAKDSIGRVTRQAVNCAKLGASEQVIDIIAMKMESEQRFQRRIDLFLAVDSIVQWSHNQKGTPAGVYRSLVQNTLPRLLSAAAPPGNFARENRRHCLGILKLWLERNIFPETVVRHFMREVEYHDADKPDTNANQRLLRTDRPLDDPIREMDGMQVDEYGSNASFPLPGLLMHRMADDEDSGGGRTSENPADEPVSFGGSVHRHPRILEQVEGELEMEDVSPVHYWEQTPHYMVPPPLPSSPPPSTPPPPSPPRD